jgi:hypothetical protein
MKVNIEIDMTPEEARRFMGLPDMSVLNEKFVGEMTKRMQTMMDDPEAMMKAWMAFGGQGLEQFQQILWDGARRASGLGKKSGDKPGR